MEDIVTPNNGMNVMPNAVADASPEIATEIATMTPSSVIPISIPTSIPTSTTTVAVSSTGGMSNPHADVIDRMKLMIKSVERMVEAIELDLKRVKITLTKLSHIDPQHHDMESLAAELVVSHQPYDGTNITDDGNGQVVEGIFDGYYMLGNDQKKYPMPLNYSSKTKLVSGDKLRLKIMDDGKLIYKLVSPVERKHMRAILSKEEDNKSIAITDDGQTYFLNQAAVTFFKGRAGDEIYIITNKDGSGSFAAIEAIIKK